MNSKVDVLREMGRVLDKFDETKKQYPSQIHYGISKTTSSDPNWGFSRLEVEKVKYIELIEKIFKEAIEELR